ncbi:hypothetical protein Rhe02_13290 [Rhizocola hellebori]|uniref:Uncharacterized protein n=1 Tax=Rhizocola hellebori TaxID=1392758 RepID=A0A8J3Q4N1_9ACTN|nr:hypothetical protein [Rhizocola hellebori]GIH03262.1 hypothetical protein Rhe02_13290 [Rhizocola hellebori]
MRIHSCPSRTYTGVGSCGELSGKISLNGRDDLLVGSVNSPATWVRVTAGPDRLSVPVVGGYFLVPPRLTERRDDVLTFTLLSAEGAALSKTACANKPGC